jgi:transposase
MYKKYRVELTPAQRAELQTLISSGHAPARTISHAHILIKADAAPAAPAWKDEQIAAAFDLSVRTVVRVRQAFLRGGLARAVARQRPSGRPRRKIDGTVEAHLVALVCSDPPAGAARWTLHLLADHLVQLVDLESVSHETVRRTLKKMNLSPG